MKTKHFILILLSVISLAAFAQKPKLAVYMTGDDPINEIVSNRLVDDLARGNEYTTVERTASFLAALSKEHNYERSGEVNDEQIAALGKQFNVQYVCVASVLDVWGGEKYITARIIDAETAEVVASGSSNGSMQNSSQLIGALNTLSEDFLKAMHYNKQSDAKKVAVYVTKTGNRDVDIVLGDQLVAGFAKSGRYAAIERTSGFLQKIKEEQGYQRSGAVDDIGDLTRLGQQFGVHYVCVVKTTAWAGDYFISTRMIDVKTGEVANSNRVEGAKLENSQSVVNVAQNIATELSKGTLAEQARLKAEEEARIKAEEKRRIEAEEELKKNGWTEIAYGINMKMIWVEGGEFMMGCTSEQGGDCRDDEKNVYRVTLDGFWIGIFEVTQAQWERVMGTNIYQLKSKKDSKGVGPEYPMYNVNWEDAMEFCRLLSNKTSKNYTLPTEAQWEYAARGGKNAEGKKYAGSNVINEVAWYGSNRGIEYTFPCGTKQANALGIYDMTGNVWEWCKDWYSDNYRSNDNINPSGPTLGSERVLRGGSWTNAESDCRVTNRYKWSPDTRSSVFGFRVVCIP